MCTHRAKRHVRMGHPAHVSGVAHLVGVVQRIVRNNGNMNSEPKYLACEESPICAFYYWTLFFSSVDILASTVGWLLCLFFSESPAIGYVQYWVSWLRKIYTLQRASRVVLPVLRHKQMSSRRRHVMHVSNRDFKLTFISVTDTYVRTYIHPKNRSLIQSFALRRSAITHSTVQSEWE